MSAVEFYTTEELAKLFRTTAGTVHYWRSASPEKCPPAIKIGRRLLFRRSDVEAWLLTRKEAT